LGGGSRAKAGSYSEDICDTRIRQVVRYSCVSVTVGDTFLKQPVHLGTANTLSRWTPRPTPRSPHNYQDPK
jgi:hypothetical protein